MTSLFAPGPPAFLPLARPSIGEAELAAQARALASGRLVLGPENAAFEEALARATGRRHAICVSSGTAALHLALWALDLPPDGEILVPAFTFPAPANAARSLGHEVVPVDVDDATWNLSPEAAARRLGPQAAAIVAVDQFGLLADHEALLSLALARGIPLVEDAACALGAADAAGRPGGSFGRIACLSFHARKILTTGEGGAVLTDDDRLAARVRALRNHGQEAPGRFTGVGLNYRLSEPAAAVGRVQLERLPELVEERRRLVLRYRERFADHPVGATLRFQEPPPGQRHAWQTFAVFLPEGVDRARVIAALRARDIEAGPATYALHRLASFEGRPGCDAAALPVADRLHDRALALPLWNGMPEDAVDRVVAALLQLLP